MKIAVVTTSRSEYSLDRWTIKEIQSDQNLELQLLVGGSHLSPPFGETYKEIEEDGIKDFYKIEFTFGSDSSQALSKSVGVAAISVAQIFEKDRPDFLLINGDRYELYSFIIPAMMFRIPIGHIGGGEVTEGAIDDQIRHSITKLSHLHFVSCKEYARNISLLGEEDWRIHIVGAEGLENIIRLNFYTQEELSEKIGLNLKKPTILATYHPATAEKHISVKQQISSLLEALEKIENLQIIFTAPGVEVGSEIIMKKVKQFVSQNSGKTRFFESLGGKLYLSILKNVRCIVGNSSSGIIEAPALKLPTINIGSRQKGRVRAKSVIDISYDVDKITNTLERILSDKEYVEKITSGHSPFGDGKVSKRIVRAIKNNIKNPYLMKKKLDFDVKKDEWIRYF